jgi:hypothetical protein
MSASSAITLFGGSGLVGIAYPLRLSLRPLSFRKIAGMITPRHSHGKPTTTRTAAVCGIGTFHSCSGHVTPSSCAAVTGRGKTGRHSRRTA